MSQTMSLVLTNDYSMLINGYAKEVGKSEQESKEIFLELMKFLWIGVNMDERISPSVVIDDMRHYLLEQKEEYENLCMKEFGCHIDHVKSEKPDVQAYNRGRELYSKIFNKNATVFRPNIEADAALCQPAKNVALCQPAKIVAICQPAKK